MTRPTSFSLDTQATLARFVLPVVAAAGLGCASMGAQSAPPAPRVIDGTPRCATCVITRTKLTTLASSGDSIRIDDAEEVLPGLGPTVHSDGRGRAYVDAVGGLAVFDSTGRLIHVLALPGMAGGRPGPALGEIWIGPGDTVLAEVRPAQPAQYRAVFDPEYRLVREQGYPSGIQGLLPFADGGAVFVAAMRPRSGDDTVLHVANDRGAVLRSFGGVADATSCPRCVRRRLFASVPNRPTEFWTMPTLDYRLQRWTVDGLLRADFVVKDAAWFRGANGSGTPDEPTPAGPLWNPPPPTITGVCADDRGRVWVLGHVAASGWQPVDLSSNELHGQIGGVAVTRLPTRGFVLPDASWARIATNVTTVIDVIDPTTGSLLVSQRFEHEQMRLAGPGVAYVRRRGPDGAWYVDLYRLSLLPSG